MALDRVAKIGDKGGMNGNQQKAAQDIGGITIEHADGWAVQVRVRGTDSGPGLRGALTVVEVPGCGHAPALNVPAQLDLVSNFLAAAGRTGA